MTLPMTFPMNLAGKTLIPTAAERAAGRFMRAPDHAGADGGAAPEAAPGADPSIAADAGAPAPGTVSEPATGQGDAPGATASEPEGKQDAPADGSTGDDGSIAGGAGDKPTIEVLGAPEAYEVKAPDGGALDQEVLDLATPVLRDLNLSNAAAQRLVDLYAGEVMPKLAERAAQAHAQQAEEDGAQLRKQWKDETMADPELGGANFQETVDAIGRVWDKYGIKRDAGIRQLLDESGLGNHPDLVRFLSRVGKTTGEAPHVPADGQSSDNRPIWDRVYADPIPATENRT